MSSYPPNAPDGYPPAAAAPVYPVLQHVPSASNVGTILVPQSPMAGAAPGTFAAPYPSPAIQSPTAVMNPLQSPGLGAQPVPITPVPQQQQILASPLSMYKPGAPAVAAPRVSFVKHSHFLTCIRTAKHELILSPGLIIADRTGCCCSFERDVVSAKNVTSWATETQSTCGNSFCCCPGRAHVEVRTDMFTKVLALRTPGSDSEPYGNIQNAMRQTINSDKRAPIVVNDAGAGWSASTCVCFCFDVNNKLQLGGQGAYDVLAVRTEQGCFQRATRADATSAPAVSFTRYTNSIGACACIKSNLGACHCGEQLALGTSDGNTIYVATNKGQAKEAVTELYKRSRHPMMPDPVVTKQIKGTTYCCGQESELTITTESITLSQNRFPTGCFVCAPCQAADQTSVNIDEVRLIRVEEESPCALAYNAAKTAPATFKRLVESILFLRVFAIFDAIFSLIYIIPYTLYQVLVGTFLNVVCLPCRRAMLMLDGPADLTMFIRPKNDTGGSLSDVAVDLQNTLRTLRESRRAQLAAIESGAGKDQVLFTDMSASMVGKSVA